MILDRQLCFSDGQALSGATTTASTDLIDFTLQTRNPGIGTPLFLVVGIPVAAGGTTPTLAVAFQVDDNAAFSSAATLFTSPTYTAAQLTAGAQFVYPLPISGFERYARLSYTQTGTSPTVTVDAHIVTAAELVALYPVGFTVA